MIVDDEPMVLDVLQRGLVACGFDVSTFADSRTAIAAFEAAPDSFDAVVTDQTMPNLSGYDLAAGVLAVRPEIPVVLVTGYSDQENQLRAKEAGIRHLLPKPIQIRDLGEVLVKLTRNLLNS